MYVRTTTLGYHTMPSDTLLTADVRSAAYEAGLIEPNVIWELKSVAGLYDSDLKRYYYTVLLAGEWHTKDML